MANDERARQAGTVLALKRPPVRQSVVVRSDRQHTFDTFVRARYRDRSELLMIGPFTDLRDGAMAVFTTREAAEEFVTGDPFVLHGVVRKWRILEWLEALVPDAPDPAGALS